MKYVQTGILVCLIMIAGLLAGIYVGQSGERAAEQALDEPVETAQVVSEPDVPAAEPEARANEPAAVEKPSPVRPKPKPAGRTPQALPDPVAIRPDPRAEPLPEPVLEPTLDPTFEPTPERPVEPVPVVLEEPKPKPAPAPRQPRRVTLRAGTDMIVRLDFALASDRNYGGDTFTSTLDEPIVVDDMVIAEKGARVEGVVVDAVRAGRVKGLAKLSVELARLDTADGQTLEIVTNRVHRQAEKSTKNDAKKVGIGAGIGAIIGAIAGGGKGAAIGAGAGAGAGGGVAAATRGKPVRIPAEARLAFRLMEQLEIVEKF